MQKTLYYDIIFREVGWMYNEGFLIVNLDGERIISMEGVLTCDYIKAKMEKDNLIIKYYALDDYFQTLVEEFKIQICYENLEIPLNIRVSNYNETTIEIKTTRKISNNEIKKKYDERLKKFKENNVFQEERW